ncbi:dienelactone hydrolase family protein [Citrobacter sp. JGM124]|uniref:alpha/beta hydrolase n=1 Tax=Citrobacter sp. JGM124 TaxID=2799789 RepID=UPI001BAC1448|nr:dienelactone hydrolase family protein [Citrobacter sp. JGM124]MBS0847425.1 prolyl oligopeptidase family serine peptidase [Citrobacter sp. JGM124]
MKKLIILLHGVGSSGADLEGLGYFVQQMMPDIVFASPDGSSVFDGGGEGYQWFSVTGVTDALRTERVVEARAAFDNIINGILAEHEIVPGRDKVMLLGFSQGSIMALDALVTDRFPLAGVVAFSGRLSSPKPYHPSADAAVLLVHGMADTVIPWTESEAAATGLTEAGVSEVETLFEPGVVHTISSEGIARAMAFITEQFELN